MGISGKLTDKVAVVTGSSMGCGRAAAIALAKEGASVVINSRHSQDCEKVVAEIEEFGGVATAIAADLSTEEGAKGLIDASIEHFGKVDILVNNAGITGGGEPSGIEDEQLRRTMATNFFSNVYTTKFALPGMIERGWGRIINTSSVTAFHYSVGTTDYTSSKGAVYAFSRLVARSYWKQGITCNVVMPEALSRLTDFAENQMGAAAWMWFDQQICDEAYGRYCMNLPNPETFAPFYAYLASDEGGKINGQCFTIGSRISLLAEPAVCASIAKPDSAGVWTQEDFEQLVPATFGPNMTPCPAYPENEYLENPFAPYAMALADQLARANSKE